MLNPAVRMSWILKHWEQKYITIAQNQIRQTVSLSSWTMLREAEFAHRWPFQMQEYRQRLNTTSGQSVPASAYPNVRDVPVYMSLAAQYDLEDDMSIGAPGSQEQSIEQEYQAYITAPLSQKRTPILKFWEVRGS